MNISLREEDIINDLFTQNKRTKFDESKIQYNSYYKSFEFWAKKWPKGYSDIPHINLVIQNIIEKNKNLTPLEEITERQEIINNERPDNDSPQ